MNFDQMGKQHISRRRKPSPLRNKKQPSFSFDSSFPQKVSPRPGRSGTAFAARKIFPFGKGQESLFGGFSRKNSRTGGTSRVSGRRRQARSGFDFSNLLLIAAVLAIGVIGTNWQSIADNFERPYIATTALVDPSYTEGRFTPPAINPWVQETAAAEIKYENIEDIPLNLTETFSWTDETVQPGDSVSKFAARFSLLQGSIIALNKMENAWDIKIGQKLKIPNMDGIPYTVLKNDSISRIAEKMKVPQNAILDANDLLSDTIRPGDILFIPGARMDAADFDRAVNRNARKPMLFPVGGRITSGYGWREDPVRPVSGEKRFHKAVDFAGKIGDPIKAAMQGTVLYTDHNPNLGNFIVLKHGEYQSLYAHLSAYSVKMGDTVKQGQEIGKIGNTGYSTGPHLHFEVFQNGNRINPLELMK